MGSPGNGATHPRSGVIVCKYPAQPGFNQVAYGYPGQQQAYYPPNPQGYPPQGYPQQTYPPQGYGYPQPQVV
uniref:Annexin A7 n=1 Tax=Ascaris lumbricoides TaxID=6252 RepID=A0A0M3HW47_ASCLU